VNERVTRTLDELWEELEKAWEAEREKAERVAAETEKAQDEETKK